MRLTKVVGVVLLAMTQITWAKFDPCRFNFGFKDGTANINEADIIAQYTWAGASITSDIISMLNKCKSGNKTPALYMYIIAKSSGLGDCNTGGGLCSQGANYIRNNKDKIKGYYRDYAAAVKNNFGSTDPVLCMMEPDYFQYTGGSQNGGGLSYQDAGKFMGELVDIIKEQLPNALISLDISPWIEDQGATNSWLTSLPLDKIHFMNTSGGISQAGSSLIKGDNRLTWQKVHDITKKCIIADCGYGTGGVGTGHDGNWDNVSNINNRMKEGVIGIIQFSPKQDWGNTIKSISGQLSDPICSCAGFGAPTYTLTVNAGANGKITKSPDQTSYDSGSTVTLTATANSNYKFRSWGGDASGTATTVEVVMNANKTVTATFVDPSAKPTYSLAINVTGSGVVEITPKQADYDSGAVVALQAYVANGSTFNGWSGALTGKDLYTSLVMNENKTVTAAFTGNTIVIANLVKNGNFSNGTSDNWNLGAYNNTKGNGTVADGAYKLAIETAGTEPWHIQFIQGGISLTKDEDYILSFTAWSQSNTSIIANIGMAAEPYTTYSQERTVELTTTKKTFEIKFTMQGASTTDARLEFNCGKATGTLQIDDISLAVAIELNTLPRKSIPTRLDAGLLSGNERVSVSWYDHAGRLLQHASGDYTSLMKTDVLHHPGSYIAVIRIGDRQFVKRTVNVGK